MSGSLKIKVCGMRDPGNIEQVCSLGPDFVGYIFYSESKRFIGYEPDPAIFRIPGPEISRVGVFVNEEIARVKEIFEDCKLDMVQLHGSESPLYCRSLKELGIPVIKAIDPHLALGNRKRESSRISGNPGEYVNDIRYFLFDTPGEGYGGTGHKFNWKLLDRFLSSTPFILSGGIGPNDAKAIAEIDHDRFFAVDVNSRFELSPGLKDIQSLEVFISEIRN